MLVDVVAVERVTVAVVEVIDMAVVVDGLVAAVGAMGVVVIAYDNVKRNPSLRPTSTKAR